MKSTDLESAVHIVFLLGKVPERDKVPYESIARAVSDSALVLSIPWSAGEPSNPDIESAIRNMHDATVLGREISVATGWSDEPTFFILVDSFESLTSTRLDLLRGYLSEMSASASSWGKKTSYCIHQLDCLSYSVHDLNYLSQIAHELNGRVGSIVQPDNHALIKEFIEENSRLNRLIESTYKIVAEMGLSVSDSALAEARLLSHLRDLLDRGVSVDFSRDVTFPSVARLMAEKLIT